MEILPESILVHLRQQGIVHPECVLGQQMSGTTTGKVYAVNLNGEPLYVLKIDMPEHIGLVARFLQTYPGLIFPRLHYVDPAYTYLIYGYVKGKAYEEKWPKSEWLSALAERLINRYERTASAEGWGWLEEPLFDSWPAFLTRRIVEARDRIGDLLPEADHLWVMQLPGKIYRSCSPQACLLHGDCGVHNFIFDSGVLRGVIDPTPMIGPPHYDFLFAFCSSPDDLTMDTLLHAARFLKPSVSPWSDRRMLIGEVLIHLYCRIATCLMHHPADLAEYLEAWAYWIRLRNGGAT